MVKPKLESVNSFVVSILLTVISGLVGYGVVQKDKQDDRVYNRMVDIDKNISNQSRDQAAHLEEFKGFRAQVMTRFDRVEKTQIEIKSTQGHMKDRQDSYWPPLEHK